MFVALVLFAALGDPVGRPLKPDSAGPGATPP
jgi:hypothetical protein